MKVAVTGVAGKVGGHVVRELDAHGHDVVGLDQREPAGLALHEFHSTDLTDIGALERAFAGCDVVVHLAAISMPGVVPEAELFRVNTMGTFNGLEAAVRCAANRFVMASSEATLGFTTLAPGSHPDYVPIDEDHAVRPVDAYGLSKVLGEEMCRSYSRRGAISTVCLRTCYVWSLDWRENAIDGVVNDERTRRGLWTYVDARDAAVAYRLACEAPDVSHETLFVVAPDSAALHPTDELLAEFHPDTPRRGPIGESDAIVSGARARERLGFQPRHSWRDQIPPEELESYLEGSCISE